MSFDVVNDHVRCGVNRAVRSRDTYLSASNYKVTTW